MVVSFALTVSRRPCLRYHGDMELDGGRVENSSPARPAISDQDREVDNRKALAPVSCRTFPSSWRWAPRWRSVADMGGAVEPVLDEVDVAVDADVGGFAVGERESSGQGQQQ